jgi:hypothetical protein
VETYSLLVLIIVHDTPGPYLALGEPSMFHHSQLRNLPSYLSVGASLQNSKLYKVIAESKTQLVCHLLRLL